MKFGHLERGPTTRSLGDDPPIHHCWETILLADLSGSNIQHPRWIPSQLCSLAGMFSREWFIKFFRFYCCTTRFAVKMKSCFCPSIVLVPEKFALNLLHSGKNVGILISYFFGPRQVSLKSGENWMYPLREIPIQAPYSGYLWVLIPKNP